MAKVHKLMAKDSSNSPGVLKRPDGKLTTSHEESAKVLLDTHFPGNVLFKAPGPTQSLTHLTQSEAPFIDELVPYDRTLWAISTFKPFKSPGYDEIYPVFLQKSWYLIHGYLMDVYRASLGLGHIPKTWQRVKVVFIPKPGKDDYTSPKSFRPISLTSFMLKGLERMLLRI